MQARLLAQHREELVDHLKVGGPLPLGPQMAAGQQVVHDAERREELPPRWYQHEPGSASLPGWPGRHVVPLDGHRARLGWQVSGNCGQQAALASAVEPEEADDLALPDPHAGISDDPERSAPDAEAGYLKLGLGSQGSSP